MGGGSEIVSSGPNTPVLGLCCALQQACLQICGNTKTYCDEQFSNCNNEVCGSLEEEEEKSKCQKASILYKAMVKVGQCEKVSHTCCPFVDSKTSSTTKDNRRAVAA